MTEYQVLARKYRPQRFSEVLGQPAIVTTLKNAIKMGRLAHAYLFCGSRGTGKTTLARVFAKALNCQNPSQDGEPCNTCTACKEIVFGSSLDVLEIDGASNRGIDDIRQINETVGYASTSGKYKIYIIDEVHMLTKEAFNALLKTLEEPPRQVIFIFATTEPHKVLPTILSRCQRFNLSRIPLTDITDKLKRIAKEMSILAEDEAIHLIAERAEGGLRDAESLFDQIIAFHDGKITAETVTDVLGIMPKDALFDIDNAGKEGRLNAAFEIAHRVFSEGKDVAQFIDSMIEHFRALILVKLSYTSVPYLSIPENDRPRYEHSARLYTQEQCLTIIDLLIDAQNHIRFQASPRIALEAILLKVMRTHHRLPIGYLVKRLAEMEQTISEAPGSQIIQQPENPLEARHSTQSPQEAKPETKLQPQEITIKKEEIAAPEIISSEIKVPEVKPQETKSQEIRKTETTAKKIETSKAPAEMCINTSITIDPSPTPQELGLKTPTIKATAPKPAYPSPKEASPIPPQTLSRYDTLLQFSAVELEGTVKKK